MNSKKENIKKWITFIILTLGAGTIYKLCFLKDAFYGPMQEYLGLTHTQLWNAMSISGAVTTIGFILAVWLSDRVSKRILLLSGLVDTIVAFSVLGIFAYFGSGKLGFVNSILFYNSYSCRYISILLYWRW